MNHRLRRAIVTAAVFGLFGFMAGHAGADETVRKVIGSGVDDNGLEFDFQVKSTGGGSATGPVSFETNSFGDPVGTADCINAKRHKAGFAGVISNPQSGLDHFMLIVKDTRRNGEGPPDTYVAWLRGAPFDCDTEIFGADFDDSMEPIRSGRIRVR